MGRKRLLTGFLCLALFMGFLSLAAPVRAGRGKVVRVGWFESMFNYTDAFGRRTGYAYEYQQKIAAYTGWTYEYVEGSWPELKEMLIRGEIDLLGDVSFTEERAEQMLYSALPMGQEEFYIYVAADNGEITPYDLTALNGKRLGIIRGSVQEDFFLTWAGTRGIAVDLRELEGTETEAMRQLTAGELDAYVSYAAYGELNAAVPICKIGTSEYYFAVRKDRPDLLEELDLAMNRIWEENKYYNLQMLEKYSASSGANAFLSARELDWATEHGPIRVGYLEGFLPFCAADGKTGELMGALKDYLDLASGCVKNAVFDFAPTAYAATEAAMEALGRGEVDCVFPVSLSSYDGEVSGFLSTACAMETEMYAIVATADHQGISPDRAMTAALQAGYGTYEEFLKENYPNWTAAYYPDTESCMRAVALGEADCALVCNYRLALVGELFNKYKLTSLATGRDMHLSFAVRREDDRLYSILDKTISLIPATAVHSAITAHLYNYDKVTLLLLLKNNWLAVVCGVTVVFVLILLLLHRSLRLTKQAAERQRLIAATETDRLTGLYDRNFLMEYTDRMYRAAPEKPMDAVVVDIEQFHSVNAMNGRGFGDRVLCALAEEIRAYMEGREGLAGRVEADRFALYCPPLEDPKQLFDRLQGRLDQVSRNVSIRLRMGVMPWQEDLEPVPQFERARTACNLARGKYNNRLIVFDEKLRQRENLEQRLLGDLRRGVEEREFQVWYQPKFDIQSDPPRLRSAEALIRWRHPELGMVSPGDFIPLFERHGKIGEVDKYAWEEAARQIADWRSRYGITVPVSVNVSRVDVLDPALEQTLDLLVERYALERSVLKLEVTESAYTEYAERVIRVIQGLRYKGYEIEMDDFGSGYSSLGMLSSMPIDVLKMDRAFILNIEQEEKDLRLVELILEIAKSLNVPVVAEGVETENQMLLLKRMGCALVQGYYFSKPLPPEEFEAKMLGTPLSTFETRS